MATAINVLVIHQDWIMREGINALFATQTDPHIVLLGTLAPQQIASHDIVAKPTIIVLESDCALLGRPSILKLLQDQYPDASIVLIGEVSHVEHVYAAFHTWIHGWIMPNELSQLIRTLEMVAQGIMVFDPLIMTVLWRFMFTNNHQSLNIADALSTREREIVTYIQQGWTNKQIADQVGITLKTVETHITNIYKKIGVRARSELVKPTLQPVLQQNSD